jgi:hypothetical protein
MVLTRRQALAFLSVGSGWLMLGCEPSVPPLILDPKLPDQIPGEPVVPRGMYSDSVDALFDVLVPGERDAAGKLLVPGARESGADRVLRTENFLELAIAQGLVRPISDELIRGFEDLAGAVRTMLNQRLDALATLEKPQAKFHELPARIQAAVVQRLFDDDASRPLMLVMRAVAFVAFLGAVESDAGLRALGFPPFENLGDGRAVSGYPRTRAGRLIDVKLENLGLLAASGDLDDYTFNRAPIPTVGDDLSLVLDATGELK